MSRLKKNGENVQRKNHREKRKNGREWFSGGTVFEPNLTFKRHIVYVMEQKVFIVSYERAK